VNEPRSLPCQTKDCDSYSQARRFQSDSPSIFHLSFLISYLPVATAISIVSLQ
jgi:hypothetical protein